MKKLIFLLLLFVTFNVFSQEVNRPKVGGGDVPKTATTGQLLYYNGGWIVIPSNKLVFDGDTLRGNISGVVGGGADSTIFATQYYVNSQGFLTVETDPIWNNEKGLYVVLSDTTNKIATKTDLINLTPIDTNSLSNRINLKRDLTNNNFNLTSTSTADSIVTYENGIIKRMLIQDISTVGITKMSIDTVITSTGVNFITVSFNMVDDGIFPFTAGKTIKGEFYLSGRSERGTFFVASDGSVIVDSGYYLDNANTDGMIDVYDGGTNAIFKNRLGLAVDVVLKYTQL